MGEILTVSGYLLNQMVETLRERGKDPGPLIAEFRLEEQALAEADARVPLNDAWECWQRAFALCEEPHLGLTIASQIGEGYPMLRYSLRNAATLGDAFDRWGRFYGLISDHGAQSLERHGVEGRMRCDRQVDVATPIVIEDWMVGQWLSLGRFLAGVEWIPIGVQLEHEPDGNRSVYYEEWFGAPVNFGADHAEMQIPVSVLNLPIRGSDPSLSAVLDQHIHEVLSRRSNLASFTTRARAAMAKQLDGGDPAAASIARSLNVSERTLLRRLRDEGTTPTDLLRDLRLEFAEKYLDDPTISVTEISYLLGYSEASAFHRAFKRWTGTTPAEYRSRSISP